VYFCSGLRSRVASLICFSAGTNAPQVWATRAHSVPQFCFSLKFWTIIIYKQLKIIKLPFSLQNPVVWEALHCEDDLGMLYRSWNNFSARDHNQVLNWSLWEETHSHWINLNTRPFKKLCWCGSFCTLAIVNNFYWKSCQVWELIWLSLQIPPCSCRSIPTRNLISLYLHHVYCTFHQQKNYFCLHVLGSVSVSDERTATIFFSLLMKFLLLYILLSRSLY